MSDLKVLCYFCLRGYEDCDCLDNQSGEKMSLYNIEQTSQSRVQQTGVFVDDSQQMLVSMQKEEDPSFYATTSNDDSLGAFLARPVQIASVSWATTDPSFSFGLNPWQAFFESTSSIRAKTEHYHNLKADLHIKIVLNGNAFHYGRVVASYTPYFAHTDFPTIPPTGFQQSLVNYTSRPHVILDPATSQGAEMILPFIYPHNAVPIAKASAWDSFGELSLVQLSRLKHANGATDSVTISVFAWAENVSLTVPTSVVNYSQLDEPDVPDVPDLENQSGIKDEYSVKPSSILSTAGAVLGSMVKVPAIAPYARVSSVVLNSLGNVAAAFGYSRPVDTETSTRVIRYTGNMSNVNVLDNSVKLSTDAKQEVTVDPRTVGLGSVDEMSIQYIATKMSYVFTVPWSTSDTPLTKLATIGVTPFIWRENVATLSYTLPPCMHAAAPFHFWRGTMKYRFQIVSSSFHRGRLRISYDPYDASPGALSTQFSRVVDISQERDIVMEVAWGVQIPYLSAKNMGTDAPSYAVGVNLPPDPTHFNGQLSISVQNDLTIPNSTVNNDIEILVFVSAGDDIELQSPSSTYLNNYVFSPPAVEVEEESRAVLSRPDVLDNQGGEVLKDESCCMPDVEVNTNLHVGPSQDAPGHISDICFGERIFSFRSLIKRYELHEVIAPGNIAYRAWYSYKRRGAAFPSFRGRNFPGLATVTPSNIPYNAVASTILNWLSPAYVGRRGGIRMKFFHNDFVQSGIQLAGLHGVVREAALEVYEQSALTMLAATNPTKNQIMHHTSILPIGHSGMQYQPIRTQPAIEVEIPFANNVRFIPGFKNSSTKVSSFEPSYEYHVYSTARGDVESTVILKYIAAADDFSFFFYIGCPPLYYEPTWPPPYVPPP